MRKIITKYLLLILLLSSYTVWGQEFNSSVDKTTVGQNERFQVYFTLTDADINSASGFRGPSFKGLHVLSGPNQSSSMQIINGKVSGSLTYSYIVSIAEIGDITIGSAQVTYRGKQYETNPIKIKVVKSTAQQQQQKSDDGISNEDLAKNVFIRAIPDKNTVYQGEQVTIIYKLYTRLNISSPQINKLPSYQGFWTEELETSNNIRFEIEMYEGERYRVATIKKAALFPSKSGKLTVTPFELKIPVQVKRSKSRGNSVFDEFFNDSFFGRTETIDFVAKSNTVTINSKPLPSSNVPASFKGAVGNFNFKSSLSKDVVDANESVTLTMTISGEGNIELLDIPEINLPAGFEKYDPKSSTSKNNSSVIGGTKKIEYLIVPRVPGEKEIPAVEFSYFNPKSGKYITKKSPTYKLTINESENGYQPMVSGYSKEDVKLLSQDIRFIKTSDFAFIRKTDLVTLNNWFWYAIAVPFVLFIGFLGFKKRQDKLSGNVGLMKYNKAEKSARAKLKAAKTALDASDITNFYNELSNALFGYLEDKLGLQKADFSHDRVIEELKSRAVNESLVIDVKEIAERCEFARFAPKDDGNQAATSLYDQTVKTIVELENSISKKKK